MIKLNFLPRKGRGYCSSDKALPALFSYLFFFGVSCTAAECVLAPPGLVSLWSGKANADDSAGTNNGVLMGNVSFAAGMVDQGLLLNAASIHVHVPRSQTLDFANEITADCAPRSRLGDGAVTVAGRVQVGRYAAGLDPATRAGGRTNDLGPTVLRSTIATKTGGPGLDPRSKGLTPRQVKVANSDLAPGQPGTVSVFLEAQGNENALSFSLAFDPTVFTNASATLGGNATGATMDINASQVSSGRLALVLALPIGSTFPAGSEEVVRVTLTPVVSALGVYTLALTDQPVVRQVVDPAATLLSADYINGSILVNPLPILNIAYAQKTITLTWPLWATNFSLQEADGARLPSLSWSSVPVFFIVTNNAASVTLGANEAIRLYRLQK